MAKAFWIATYRSVTSPAVVEAYAKIASPAIWAAGGRNLVRGIPAKTFEAGLALRTVVIEFESVAAPTEAYNGPTYQTCLTVLGDAAERDIRIVEGAE